MGHLLVTNDFPPKVGGIQSYLWELWRRLPPERVTVLTTPHPAAHAFDAEAPMRVVRTRQRVLLPTPALVRRIVSEARACAADLVVLDPALPLGALGPALKRRGLAYAVVVHGAEVTVPGRLPLSRALLGHVLRGADHVIAAGHYPLAEAERAARTLLPSTVVAPGVDCERLHPADDAARAAIRARLLPSGHDPTAPLVVSASRLVPRKGVDVLIDACARLADRAAAPVLVISGSGRDRARLERRLSRVTSKAVEAGRAAPVVHFLGRLDDEDLAALYRCADVYAMLCRNRWGGLEQEGFGIVFLEAAASGVAQVAGRSGGSAEAVAHGETGLVVDRPRDVGRVADAIASLLDHPTTRVRMGLAARERAEREFAYDRLAERLDATLDGLERAARDRSRQPAHAVGRRGAAVGG